MKLFLGGQAKAYEIRDDNKLYLCLKLFPVR